MTYFLAAYAIACLAFCLWLLLDYERLRQQRDACDREAQEWAKLYWDLRDETPARDANGRFTQRGK